MSTSDLLPPTAAAAELGISEKTLKRWRDQGKGPPLAPGGKGHPLYNLDALRRWRASQPVVTTVRYLAMGAA